MNESAASEENGSYSSDEEEMGTLDYLPNQYAFDPSFHSANAQRLFQEQDSKDSK